MSYTKDGNIICDWCFKIVYKKEDITDELREIHKAWTKCNDCIEKGAEGSMCDFCGRKPDFIYPFDPDGEIYICKKCDRYFGPRAREVAFKIKNNISKNMARFLENNCFYVVPEMKEWIKKHST